MRTAPIAICLTILPLISCSSAPATRQPIIYAAGDKATIGPLVYNMTDGEFTQQLGDDPNSARAAQNRFYLLRLSVSNSGNEDKPIPAMMLVDDDGTAYNELSDGAGIPNWLGVVRKVGAAQTEQGYVAFDVPLKHYRLRLNDPLDEREVAIDVPFSFVHERGSNLLSTPAAPSAAPDIDLPSKK
ncbi:MAG TPA: DUF4352 domain-containing protein [Bryobacteraceae bacterium]|jgi:hypothetical protein|nr:DUF4352 domain-containing protein [Bryobacteraceae bacterium]